MTEMMTEEISLVLAALLHDAGKIGERAGESLPGHKNAWASQVRFGHEAFSAAFAETALSQWAVDKESLLRLIARHHQPSQTDERLLRLADRLSAFERAEEAGDVAAAIGSVEVRLQRSLAGLGDAEANQHSTHHPLAELSVAREFLFDAGGQVQSAEMAVAAYQSLWRSLLAEAAQVVPGDVNGLLAVLKRFAWAVPSGAESDQAADVSLFEHLKSSAAIAACLHRARFGADEITALDEAITRRFGKPAAEENNPPLARPFCALVKGDLSGMQEFLYLLTSDGAARGLRGRSFYLQLLTETIARYVLRQFHLTDANLLFAGGGDFYLLLPLTDLHNKLDELRRQISKKLWQAHEGDLSLTIECVELSARDFLESESGEGFAAKWAEVSRRAYERKRRRWSELGSEIMFAKLFTPHPRGTDPDEMCQVCYGERKLVKEFEPGEARKCGRCEGFEELGRKLREATHLIVFDVECTEVADNTDWRNILRAFGADVFVRKIDSKTELPIPLSKAERATIHKIFGSDKVSIHWTEEERKPFLWSLIPVTFDHRLLADATPSVRTEDGEIEVADFSDLAKACTGVKWLGVLRMDVDDLGKVFKTRLGRRATMARLSTLSESLRLFFEGWTPQLCRQYNQFTPEGEGKDQLYLIYAGGDDLFVVGAWSALPLLAKQVRDDFRLFVGGDAVTLSGGIAIEHQKYPLYQFARDAKRALDDQAKEFKREKGRPKDALCFLQKAMGWEQFSVVNNWHGKLLEMLAGEPKLPRGFLTRMSEIHALYEENAKRQRQRQRRDQIHVDQIREEIFYAKWMWRLVYHLGRYGEQYQTHQPQIKQLEHDITRNDDHLIERLHVLARWTALWTREE